MRDGAAHEIRNGDLTRADFQDFDPYHRISNAPVKDAGPEGV